MSPQERLEAEIERICAPYNEYMSSFDEIAEHYQDNHSQHGWIRAMIGDMYGIGPSQKKEYSAARRKIERWVDGTTSPGKKAQQELAALGRKLDPIAKGAPPDGINIRIKGKFNPSPKRKAKGEPPREREIEIRLTGSDAIDFVNDPSLAQVFEMYGVDGEQFVDMLDDSADIQAEE